MRIRMIWLVLPAILAASQADHALAQERIDTNNFSAAAKAELSNGAQAVDILNRIDALYDPALVGFLDAKVRRLQVSLYDFFGDQLWPAPKGAEAFYREVRLYQEHHGTGSFTQRTGSIRVSQRHFGAFRGFAWVIRWESPCGSSWKTLGVFQGAVGAFCASTVPSASTGPVRVRQDDSQGGGGPPRPRTAVDR